MSRTTLTLLAAVVGFAACSGDNKDVVPLSERFGGAADSAPITQGDWFRPAVETTWQWQLQTADAADINTSYDVEVYDVDLFDVSTDFIAELQADGRLVICYFSAGSSEDWRPDFGRLPDEDIGRKLDGWKGERWLDIRSEAVFDVMTARLDLAVEKGCDGVEPDNVDSYDNRTGFDLEAADQLAYNQATANAAHERGLAVGLKNSGDNAAALEPYYDFSLNEECHRYDECEQLRPFTDASKPVWNAEYPRADSASAGQELSASVCPAARNANMRTLILPLDLNDAFRISCDD